MYEVIQAGVQTLTVSVDNPLILFNLDISLDWDASQDTLYLEQLQANIQDASAHLFDFTNGQVALGKVNIYHNRENWEHSDVLIYARNDLRPSANIGGIATDDITDTLSGSGFLTPTEIAHAYGPGRVRMPATWNRYGDPSGGIQGDWARALAHELGHYLLYLPDNYLGVRGNTIVHTDCDGSVMTNAYDTDDSEMLTRDQWLGDCLDTIAQYTTGRTDWETIRHFYPMLREDRLLEGPYSLPLAVTQISNIPPTQARDTLTNPYFYLKDETGQTLSVPSHEGRAYIIQADNQLLPIGSPVGDDLLARGIANGSSNSGSDTVCVFADGSGQRRTGCLTDVTDNSSHNITMHPVPDSWQPDLTIQVITTRTFAITVHQTITQGHLAIQFYGQTITESEVISLTAVSPHIHTALVTFPQPVFSAFAHVWWSEDPLLYQEIIELFINGGWGPDCWGWEYDTNTESWQTPVASPDGQIRIYDLDNILRGGQNYALQTVPIPPNLPAWLTPVGQAYRLQSTQEVTSTRNIQFQYLQRDVPDETYEPFLQLFYSSDEGATWVPLENQHLNPERNLATALMPTAENGLYVLVSTIPLALDVGWNQFRHFLDTRDLEAGLASIEDYYTIVYHKQGTQWQVHAPDVLPFFEEVVNTLDTLRFDETYWLHSTISTTLYLTPTDDLVQPSPQSHASYGLPPMTLYGEVLPTETLTPTEGMLVVAKAGSLVCGSSPIQLWQGQLIYRLQAKDRCLGQVVSFWIDGVEMGQTLIWDNTQAYYHPLGNTDALQLQGLTINATPLAGSVLQFTAVLTQGHPSQLQWQIGEEVLVMEQLSYEFTEAGLYEVVLTAVSPFNTLTTSKHVFVQPLVIGAGDP